MLCVIFALHKAKMIRKTASFFFTILFLALISAPTIIHAIDDSADISLFYSLSEEEEKGHETLKNIEVISSEINYNELFFASNIKSNAIGYHYRTYPKPHLNLISPPPEYHIL